MKDKVADSMFMKWFVKVILNKKMNVEFTT